MLILHIGLPKTGSTFLQYGVFNRQDRHTYLHGSDVGPLKKALRRFVRAGVDEVAVWRREVLDSIRDGDVLISDENIAMNAREPWTGDGQFPSVTASRLAELASDVGKVKIILGIRRQDTWLASRYSESAGTFSEFSQSDFEERVASLFEHGPHGVLGWLDYYEAWRTLVEAVGEDNVQLLPQELVADDLEHALGDLEHFLEVSGLVKAYQTGRIKLSRRNVLAAGTDQWEMRGREDEWLWLGELSSRTILKRFATSNEWISERAQLGLDGYGYY